MLRTLILAFDCEEGISERVLDFTQDIVQHMLGEQALEAFNKRLVVTEGRWYLPLGKASQIWAEMCEVAK